MTITLIAYGIAKDIIGGKKRELTIPEGSTIHQLKENLVQQFPTFATLRSLSFAVGEEYQDDQYTLSPGDEVVLIPPVAGG
jgi:molybdopterin converting factor small subunit